ncbi:DUF3822 family protein [Ochrovirga pacifica]|uniref:DUF3822 family protein n=1 Tax=Ochrovirga pacifica TaxID=1042376 RepID=UPI0002559B45|nr:DUF3822 family protein [Ochrovirga pacifica]
MNRDVNNSLNNISLSIQLSSDGFSFCIYNATSKEPQHFGHYTFETAIVTPTDLLHQVQTIFEKDELLQSHYDAIYLIHHNNLNTFVPKTHFNEDLLHQYLQYSVKTFENDFVSYDDLENVDAALCNVYIPFVNVNNYLFDAFGSFTYLHSSTVFLQNILKQYAPTDKSMFVNVYQNDFQLCVVQNKELILYNHFTFSCSEDFVYYILFVAEQLKINPNEFDLHLMGNIHKDEASYQLLYKYVRNVHLPFTASTERTHLNLIQFYL